MLSLGAGQGGTGEVGEGVASGPPRLAGRHLIHDPGINIKLKISQWEGRSQLDGGQCRADKRHGVPVSRTLSGDVLGNEVVHDHRTCGSLRKAGLAKTKSLGLDFREDQEKEVCSGLSDEDQCHSPPLVLDVPELMLPPGNFYTSRGFWHMLEGNHLSKNRGSPPQSPTTEIKLRDTDPVTPPPKPQRTFQYSAPKRWHQGENWASSASDSRLKCQVSQLPPGRISKNRKNRKSFEFEDVVQLTAQQGAVIDECQRSGIYHALSEDNIYEDIMPENQYEDVKLLEVCLPIGRPTQRHTSWTSQLPPKPHVLQVSSEKSGKGKRTNKKGPAAMHTPTSVVTVPKQALPKHHPKPRPRSRKQKKICQRMKDQDLMLPVLREESCSSEDQPREYVNKIQEIFNIKRGWKRVKTQGSSGYDGSAREETSGTDSDPEDSSTGRQRQCVYVHSTWRRRPSYSTLERERQLFQLFAVVSLRRNSPGNAYRPEITQQFPNKFEKSSRQSREAEERLKAIPKFCFPDSQDWRPCGELPSETFSFVLTSEDGSRWFGYCRKIVPSGKGKRLPEVHCIVSRLGCFNLFAKVLEEVERRREVSPALVQPFMRSLMEAPFPGPGCTITVKSFLPGSGNEVLTLCRPVDSRLEHVHFQSLLQCLSVGHLLQVFASLLLERRVIFIADKLSTLSHCAHAVLALLYPFTWQHTFVPVLPASMLDICCSPTPFLIGLLLPSLPQLLELPIEEVLIVDLCTDKFVTQVGDEDCILPNKLQVALHHILEYRETIMGQEDSISGADEELGLNSLMSEAFVHFFVELVGHYLLHMGEAAGGTQELKRDAFRKSHPSRGARQFLQLFMETQMFASFVQDRELRKGSVKGLFEVRAEEHLHSNPPPEPGGVNRFLKGLGNKMKFLQKK